MGVDIDQPGLDFGDPGRIVRGFGLVQQRFALADRPSARHSSRLSGPSGASWARLPIRQRGGIAMVPALGRQIAADGVKQRRFADAVAADEADARAGHDLHGAVVDQKPSGDPDRDVGDGKHAGLSPEPPPNATRIVSEISSCRRRMLKAISG